MRRLIIPSLVGVCGLAFLNVATLLGIGYADVAEHRLALADPTAVAAAGVAARVSPWSSSHAALLGWTLAENHNSGEAQAAYLTALRWAPADPLLWAEYAQALARLGRFDDSLTQALTQSQALAPQSPAIQTTLAEMGVSYWSHGNAEQRALWLPSMRYELDHSRASLLGVVMTRGRGQTFCRGPAHALHEDEWCASVASALLGGCYVMSDKEPVACKTP